MLIGLPLPDAIPSLYRDTGVYRVCACTQDAEQSPQTYIMFINTVSTLIAVYGFTIVKDQSVKILSNIHIRQKYFSLQAVLFIVGMQRSVIVVVFMVFNLPCESPLHIETTVDRECMTKEIIFRLHGVHVHYASSLAYIRTNPRTKIFANSSYWRTSIADIMNDKCFIKGFFSVERNLSRTLQR